MPSLRPDLDAPSVGFIGLGDQGLPMAEAIAEAGFVLHAWGLPPNPLKDLSGVPHVGHETVASLAAACDIVGLCVSTDEDVEELVTAMVDYLRPGSVIVNHGTGTPEAARMIGQFCARHDLGFLDAPVTGARVGAQARTLTTLVGGPELVAQRCEPVFRSFSANVIYLGPHGMGQLTKLVNNTLMMMNRANIADLLEVLRAGGIDPVPVMEAVKLGSGSSRCLQMLPTGAGGAPTSAVAHLTEIELLDMDIFAEAMEEMAIDAAAPIARAVSGAQRFADVLRALNPTFDEIPK